MAATPNNEPPLIQPISMTPPPPIPQRAPQSANADEPAGPPATPPSETVEKSETAGKPDSQGKAATADKDPMRDLGFYAQTLEIFETVFDQ